MSTPSGVHPYRPHANSLEEIVVVGFTLGVVSVLCGWQLWHQYTPFALYGILLVVAFMGEFIASAKWQPQTVTSKSFLIYGNKGNFQFWMMQLLTLFEYFFVRSRWWKWHRTSDFYSGTITFFVALAGLMMRFLAMKQCGLLFNHLIERTKRPGLRLATTGIYSWTRHPLYLAFWCYVVATQVLLHNWFNLIFDIGLLAHFFSVRILYEEWYLIHRLYGDEYRDYRKRVGIWIPFVKDPPDSALA